MHDNLRNCLPRRVSAMVQALAEDKNMILADMVGGGCRCSAHLGCDLKDACKRIHEAFRPRKPARSGGLDA